MFMHIFAYFSYYFYNIFYIYAFRSCKMGLGKIREPTNQLSLALHTTAKKLLTKRGYGDVILFCGSHVFAIRSKY